MPKKSEIPKAKLLVNKIVVEEGFDMFLEKGYGKEVNGRLEIAFTEALYLLEKNKIVIKKRRKKVDFNSLLNYGLEKDTRLHERYIVYRDLRARGYVVKTGFKFGCDFRVYKKGVTIKRGPKTASEHTKWIVFCVPEDYTCSFQELSRAVRLAHSIRAKMLWAIVDNEDDVTYYKIERLKI